MIEVNVQLTTLQTFVDVFRWYFADFSEQRGNASLVRGTRLNNRY
jgi:hypothetical protein